MNRVKRALCAAVAAVQAVSLISFTAAAQSGELRTDTIAAGDSHSLVIKSDLSLWAAGSNEHGQLGAGADINFTDGVKVMDHIVYVDAYGESSFAIDADGTLYGWGDNTSGQIDPAKIGQYIYTPTKLMENVAAVSAGDSHTVAVTTDGVAYGWGSNAAGELGFTANASKNSAVKLMENVKDIAAGDDFTLLVTGDGKLYASGDNGDGQFGLGNYRTYTTFTAVPMTDVCSVDAGSRHTVVLKDDGTVYAAGLNDDNQVCPDTKTRVNSFVKLSISGAEAVFAGADSSAAVNASNALYVWGDNDCGQLQNGCTDDGSSPKKAASGVISAAFGRSHSLVLYSSGEVKTAGEGVHGELFCFSESHVLKPVQIMKNVAKYSAGTDHAAAISDGRLYTWGNNDRGQLGFGDIVSRGKPERVELPAKPIDVWCGAKCTFVLTDDRRVFVFGDNTNSMLGLGDKVDKILTPTSNVMLAGYNEVQISCGKEFCIALLDGDVYGWGSNKSGTLCDLGKLIDTPTFLSDSLTDIAAVAAGDNHVLALDKGGTVWGWGANGSKQIGNRVDKVYTQVPEIIEIKDKRDSSGVSMLKIDAAGNHSVGISDDGKVWVWGANSYGQLGTGDTYVVAEATYVGYRGKAVAAGRYATAIIDEAEKLMLCGCNKFGALGDGTEKDRYLFGEGTSSSAESVDIGSYFGGYVRADGTLFCWGDNSVGQVGNGEGGISLTPRTAMTDALCSSLVVAQAVTLNKTELVLKPNSTYKLTAAVTPSNADIKAVTWSSSNSKVASVSSDGTVKAVSKGQAVITATAVNGVKASCTVTVSIPVSSFSVTPSKSKTLSVGGSFTFTAKIYPTNAVDKTLIYKSSNTSVATVSSSGKVKAVSPGYATITITAKSNPDKVRTVKVYVRPAKTKITTRKATEDGILLKWSSVKGADGYTVYRRTSANGTGKALAVISAGEATTYLDASAESGKTYYYYVKPFIKVNGQKIYSVSTTVYKVTAK
ncbi:MAG: Ig-like domain-containing protein [Oscillospiraceae bacterium]